MLYKDFVDVRETRAAEKEAALPNYADIVDVRESREQEAPQRKLTPVMQKILGINQFVPDAAIKRAQAAALPSPKEDTDPLPKELEDFTGEGEAARLLGTNLAPQVAGGAAPSAKSIDPEGEDFAHTVKIFGQQAILSSGEFVDFIRKAHNWSQFQGYAIPDLEIDGEVVDQASFEDIAKSIATLGGTTDIEEGRGAFDTWTKLAGQNLGPAGIMSAGLKVARKAADISKSVLPFLKEEFKLSVIGATSGTFGGIFFGDDEKSTEEMTQLFNIAGIMAPTLLQALPINIARKVVKNAKNNPIFDREGALELAEGEVNKHLASLVPPEAMADVEERMALVREIQKTEPDFLPSNGVLIGTEESMMTQRVVDANNYEFATSQYLRTKKAVERMTARLEKDPNSEDSVRIASALRIYASETESFLQASSARIVALEEDLRNVADPAFSSSKNGKVLRKQYDEVREVYKAQRDNLYNMVDPLGEVKFSPERISNKLKALLESPDTLKSIDEDDKGFTYFSKKLPKILEEMSRRSATPRGPSGVNEALGFTRKEKPYLTYMDIKGIYEELGTRANGIARADPSSPIPRLMNGFRKELLETLDDDMVKGSPGVVKRYEEARKFMTDEYYTRFKKGAGGKMRDENTKGDFVINLDEVGDNFWKKGNKRVAMEDFHKLFSETAGLTTPESVQEAAILARQALSDHAMNSLQDALKASPKTDPSEVLRKWKHEYRGAIDSFEDVADQVDSLETSFKTLSAEKKTGADVAVELNNNIISKYTNIDSSELMPMLLKASPEDAGRLMRDVLRSTAEKAQDASYIEKYPDLLQPTAQAGTELSNAVRRNFMSHIIGQAFDAQAEAPSAAKLIDILKKKEDVLKEVLTDDDITDLHNFQKTLKLMGDANAPLKKVELNRMKEAFGKLGFSFSSVLSRYYSAQLGKVGPVYLMADAATRLLTGISSKHFDEIYRKAMYDLDGLEKVLKHVGTPDDKMKEFLSFKDALKGNLKNLPNRSLKAATRKLLEEHTILKGFRLEEIVEQREGIIEKQESEKPRGQAPEEISLVERMLNMNDDHTGQPSRLRPEGIEGTGIGEITGVEEAMQLIDPDFTLDTPSEALTAPVSDATETDTIVPVEGEQPTETTTVSPEENAQIDAEIPPTKEEEQQTQLQDRAKEFETYKEFEKHLEKVFTARAPKAGPAFEKLKPQLRAAWDAIHPEEEGSKLDAMEELLKGLSGGTV